MVDESEMHSWLSSLQSSGASSSSSDEKKMSIADYLGFALGCVGMSLDDFCRLRQEELESVLKSYTSQRDFIIHDGWERMRHHAAVSIQPHVRKKIRARDLFHFGWDVPDDAKGRCRKESVPLSASESKARFESLVERTNACVH